MGTRQRTKRTTRRVVAGVLGLVTVAGVAFAGSAAADSPAADEARRQPLVAGTPCTVTAKACVDLDSQRSWLFEDGKIKQGPVAISSGGNGQETPIGHSLRVYRKDADHKSEESRLPDGRPAPMPWSTFFADGGIAFHSGSPDRSSAGCIHLADGDAKAWFDYLQVGDQVQVVSAKQEMAARGK
ncbi:L,D-transpeptidase [Pseudonocardia endophytica]|uniref:L,D-transpeptidase-like protein n=1 Tax=Pseudonocardia endophytica TaxID=401976 RepID=A0A4V2PH97_PSEEN|nr:L,D-transpeptidase [Pseudonocardia endophytica]TCK19826.1 L,D-transpeptidase-like protein [Pseudonocardia endophytica]